LPTLAEEAASAKTKPILAYALAALASVAFGVVGFLYVYWRRKAAVLAAQVRRAEEDLREARETALQAKNEEMAKEAHDKVTGLLIQIAELRKEQEKREQSFKEYALLLKKVTSWDALDIK
jgi:hypothetical protein